MGKKLQLIIVIFLTLSLIAFDQVTKSMVNEPVLNHGFFLGSLTESSKFFRVFFTVSILTLSLLLISFVQYLIWNTSTALVHFLALLEAGIMGNGLDKLLRGHVIDFIKIPGPESVLFVNVADLYQWISVPLILFMIWKYPERFWPEVNLRKNWIIYPHSQRNLIFTLLATNTLTSIGLAIILISEYTSHNLPVPLAESLACVTVFWCLCATVLVPFGIFWSNRVYGPFRAIERYLDARNHGTSQELKLRAGDQDECIREIIRLLEEKNRN